MLIAQSKLSPVDKAYILWAICLIDHFKNDRKMLAPYYMRQEFGDSVTDTFQFACELASGFIDVERMQLTNKGLVACEQWKEISGQIYSF